MGHHERESWAVSGINELDHTFDRALGLRVSSDLKGYLCMDAGDDSRGSIVHMGISKSKTRTNWKKNAEKRSSKPRRSTEKKSSSSVTTAVFAQNDGNGDELEDREISING